MKTNYILEIYENREMIREKFWFETEEQAEGGLMLLNQLGSYPNFYGHAIKEVSVDDLK